MNPSATGNTLRLGGSVTRAEMEKSLRILLDRLDVSGSLFWWPRAQNKRRCLTRCNQGQGSWMMQSVEQWLGLRMDAPGRRLVIRPQGLVSGIHAKGIRLGAFHFDIDWQETERGTQVRVVNGNPVPLEIVCGLRPQGAGCEGELSFVTRRLAPGESFEELFSPQTDLPDAEVSVERAECRALAAVDGIVFGPYGLSMPKLHFGECDIFLLRFAVVNGTGTPWREARVTLTLPEGFGAGEKRFFHWDYQPVLKGRQVTVSLGEVTPYTHRVAGFYVGMPARMAGGNNVLLTRHPFQRPRAQSQPEVLELLIGAKTAEQPVVPIRAVLWADGVEKECLLPVRVLDEADFAEAFDRMLHG